MLSALTHVWVSRRLLEAVSGSPTDGEAFRLLRRVLHSELTDPFVIRILPSSSLETLFALRSI